MREKKVWAAFLAAFLTPVYLELILHLFIYRAINLRIIYPVMFALAWGAGVYTLCSLLPKKVAPTALCVLSGLLTLHFEIHLVYNSIFGEFMSLMQMFTGAAAVTNFFKQMLHGIAQIWYQHNFESI